MRWYFLFIIAAFALLVMRLFFLQVVQHRLHYKASLDNILRSVPIAPPRGTIYDRAGKPLAVSKQTFGLLFIPPPDLDSYMPDPEQQRVLGLVDRYYDYFHQAGFKLNAKGKRVATNSRDDIIKDNRPDEVGQSLARLKDKQTIPSIETIEQFRDGVAGPFRDALGALDVMGPLAQLGKDADFSADWNVVEQYIASRGLAADFHGDLQHLQDRALDPLREQDEEPDSASVATALHQLYKDDITLAEAYADAAALGGTDTSSLRLAEIVNLAAFLNKPYEELMLRLNTARGKVYGHQPLLVAEELTDDQKLYIGEHADEFQHSIIEQYSFKRDYPLGLAATHVLGYAGPATQDQIDKEGYDPEERSGKEGIEHQFEEKLRGELGRRDMEIDRQGIFKNEANLQPPARGHDLVLSLDSGVQAEAYRIITQVMNDDSHVSGGAIIVSALGPENRGEILALASGPSYDPNKFDEHGYYSGLLHNSRRPLLNRAIGANYPPGSTFKLVTLTAALQTGEVNKGTGFYCPGFLTLGKTKQKFYCHIRTGHGQLNSPAEALAESCDVAFYEMGSRLTDPPEETLHNFAEMFGYGTPTGIDLPREIKGTVPDAAWKWTHMRRWGKAEQLWYGGDTYNYAIGQGFLEVTPIQDLWAASTIAWGGMRYPPRLLLASSGTQGLEHTEQVPGATTGLDPAIIDEVKNAMRLTVTWDKGTCRKLNFDPSMQVCAKTGSAQTVKYRAGHSWVVGFYPENNPRYGFICFFEHGGESGDAAIPAAVELLKYLDKADPLSRPKPGDKPAPGKPGSNSKAAK